MYTSCGEQLPLRPNYAHELGLHARAVTLSVPKKLRAERVCAACIYFCKTASAAFGAALSSYSDAAQASVKRLAKLARKIVLEILSQKYFRNFTPQNFKILSAGYSLKHICRSDRRAL